jgi:hypothetical protein
VALQSVLQSKDPGLAEHFPAHPPWQVVWQLGKVAVQPPEHIVSSWASHAIWRFGGAHATSQDAPTSAVHFSVPSKTVPPQSEKMSPARAEATVKTIVAPETRARKEEEARITQDLL